MSLETKLLERWPQEGPTLVWELETGSGYACPSVAENRLVFFHRDGDEETVECLHPETGQRYWTFRYPTSYDDRSGFGNGPRATPVIDAGRVYTIGAEGKLHCLDLKTGAVLWRRDTLAEFGVGQGLFGVCSSPLVEGDLLLVNVGAPDGPCVVAFNKHSGETVWGSGERWSASQASPVVATIHGKRLAFVFAGGGDGAGIGGLLGVDPVTGAIDVQAPLRSPRTTVSVNGASPVVFGNRVFVSTDYRTGGTLIAIRPDGGYDVVWTSDALRAHFATPIHKDGYLYGFDGSGSTAALVCVDVRNGRRVWREQPTWEEESLLNGEPRTHTVALGLGALIFADGRFLCLGSMGHLLWLDLTPEGYRELSRARLFDAAESWTAPVISRGLLYVAQNTRDTTHGTPSRLLCYDLRSHE